MLTGLRLQNFKTWRDTNDIKLSPVTAFFGTNSSGKTSILQSLLMLRQTVEDSDRNQTLALNGIVDLGTYQDIVFNHDKSLPLRIHLDWESSRPVDVIDLAAQVQKKKSVLLSSNELSFETEIRSDRKAPYVQQMSYRVGYYSFLMSRSDDAKGRYKLESNLYDFKRSQGRAWQLPEPVKCYGFPQQAKVYYQNASVLYDVEFEFEGICETIRYLGPLRNDPQREYSITGSAPRDVGKRGEYTVNALVAARNAHQMISRGWTKGFNNRRLTKKAAYGVGDWGMVVRTWPYLVV